MSEILIQVPELVLSEVAGRSAILTASDVDAAQLVLRDLATRKKEIVAAFAPAKSAANAAHKEICALEKRALDPIDAARSTTERAVLDWRQAEERKAMAAMLAARRAAEEAALADAIEMEALGASSAEVEAVVSAPVIVPVVAEPPAAEGVSVRSRWVAEVTDRAAALVWLAANADECLKIDETALGRLGQRTDGQRQVPGVKWVREQSLAVRGR